jgi:hypothetical protein
MCQQDIMMSLHTLGSNAQSDSYTKRDKHHSMKKKDYIIDACSDKTGATFALLCSQQGCLSQRIVAQTCIVQPTTQRGTVQHRQCHLMQLPAVHAQTDDAAFAASCLRPEVVLAAETGESCRAL